MSSNKKTTIMVGVLILIGYPTSILGGGNIESILNAPDYLVKAVPI
jgi:hypothetical protein